MQCDYTVGVKRRFSRPRYRFNVLNLFLIFNQKHNYASSFNKLNEVFICARTAGSCSYTFMRMKQNVPCAALAPIIHYINCKYLS